jgi:hypothetical protein
MYNLFDENPALITHCPVCQLRYNPLEAKVLEQNDASHLLYIKCRHCHSAILAVVMAGNLGLTAVGLLTDLSGDEVMEFNKSLPISFDDVINVHEFIGREKIIMDYIN